MASSGAIRAGSAFVELFTDPKKLNSGLDAAARKVRSWGESLMATGGGIVAAGLAIDKIFDRTALHFVGVAGEAGKLSARTGVAVGEITALAFAAERTGGSAEGMEHAIQHLSRTVVEAAQGSHEAMMALTRLRLSAADLARVDAATAFKRVAAAVAAIPNPMEQAALAQGVFGRGVIELLPLLRKGAAGIEEFERRARELHLTVSGDDVEAARRFNGLMAELKGSFSRVAYEIGKVALPALESMRARVLPLVTKTIEWIQANRGLVLSATKVGLLIAGAGAAVLALGAGVYAASFAVGGLSAALGGLRVVLSALVATRFGLGALQGAFGVLFALPGILSGLAATAIPLAAAAVGVALLARWLGTTAAWKSYADAARTQLEGVASAFYDLRDTALDAWGGIRDAIEAGDLQAALDVVLAGLGVAWEQTWGKLAKYLKDSWSDFKLVFVDGVSDMILSSGFLTKALVLWGTTIDKILNKIGLLSDEDLAKRLANGELIKGFDQAQRDALKKAIQDDALRRRNQEQQAHADDFDKDLADAKQRLADANAKAREARDRARKGFEPGAEAPGGAPFTGLTRAETAGTFSAAAAGRLGGGNTAAEQTARHTAATVQGIKDLLAFWQGA